MAKEKSKTSINIPFHLTRLLVADRDEYKDPDKYEEVQNMAKAMLKLLMKLDK